LGAFTLGLMSKPMLVTLPFLLLLVDRWPLKRGTRMLEKLPFFAVSAAVSVVTFVVHQQAGATASTELIPLVTRVQNTLVSYVMYLVKTLWPAGLAVFYPYPSGSLAIAATICCLVLIAVTVLA